MERAEALAHSISRHSRQRCRAVQTAGQGSDLVSPAVQISRLAGAIRAGAITAQIPGRRPLVCAARPRTPEGGVQSALGALSCPEEALEMAGRSDGNWRGSNGVELPRLWRRPCC